MVFNRVVEKLRGKEIYQFSVFLHNRVGALLDLVKLLNDQHVEVLALSVQDSADSAVTRMILTDPERVQAIFDNEDVPYSLTRVLVVELQEATNLAAMLRGILMSEANINFSYPLMIRPEGRAALVLHVEDADFVATMLGSQGFKLMSQSDLSR